MEDWIWISVLFVVIAFWLLTYEPKEMIENTNGGITFEKTGSGRPSINERLRLILALSIAWAIVMAIDYHALVWEALQTYMKLKL